MMRASFATLTLALAFATPALAQHAGHAMPDTPPDKAADPHAGHAMPANPHAGHSMPANPHAGHAMPAEAAVPPVVRPSTEALKGPTHAADTVFPPAVMAEVREAVRAEHGDMRNHRFTIDRLELVSRKGRDGFAWEDVQFWYGGDIDKLWLKSAGEGTFGRGLDGAEAQALWSHAITPFFDVQAGFRYDFGPGPDRAHLAVGLQGLAPYWFEIDAAAFLSDKGDLTARIEGEHDMRITQKLILQPRAEVELAAQDMPERAIGSGLSSVEAGLRLRYEFVPEFAPYAGVEYERAFGYTAAFRRARGDDVGGWHLTVGVRAWF